MAEVDNITVSVEASAKEAIAALNETSKSLDNVGDSSEKAGKKVKSSAEQLTDLARQAKTAGLNELSTEFRNMSKYAAVLDISKFKKDIDGVAASLAKSGKMGLAERVAHIGADPLGEEEGLANATRSAEAVKLLLKEEAEAAKKAAREAEAAQKKAAREKEAAEKKAAREAEAAQRKAARAEEAEKKRVAREAEKAAQRKARAEEKAAEATRRAIEKQQAQLQSLYDKKAKMDFFGTDEKSSSYQKVLYDIAEAEKKMGKTPSVQPIEGLEKTKALAKEMEKAAKEGEKLRAALSETGEAAKKAASKFKKFLASIGRIAMYRAIRTALKNITSALKEGLSNLYTYSQQFGTEFAPAVDNLKNHILMLKNSIATALRPVLEALMPVVVQLVDWFSKLADFIAQVLSVVFGKTDENGRYTKAVLGDLQESNEEAKELKRSLMGFDEINRLDGDNGGSKDNTALSTMFEQAEVSEKAKGVAEWIKKAVDWLKGLPWDKILPVVATLGGLLAASNLPGVKGILKAVRAFTEAHPILAGIIALLAVAALWGDKIGNWLEGVRVKVEDFFDNLNSFGSYTLRSIINLVKNILTTVTDVVGTIFRLIYKLTHGDMEGALQDLVHLLAVIITGIVNFIIDVVNIILGLVSDLINAIVKLGVWLWNEGLQPVLNVIVRFAWNNVIVPIQNGVIDLVAGFLRLIKDTWNTVATWLNEKLNWAIEKVNKVVRWLNDKFHLDLPEIPLDIIPTISDEDIKAVEATKFQPITEDVIPKIQQPDPIDLTIKGHLDASEVERKLNKLFNTLKENVGTASSAVNSAIMGQRQSTSSKVQFTQFASGGFPDAGSMFIAGERGASPEVVGTFGGRTGVMNSEQLSAALYNAFTAALSAYPQGGDIYLDGEVIYRNTVRRNNNAVRATGRSALLT